jgi:hypothetical protein
VTNAIIALLSWSIRLVEASAPRAAPPRHANGLRTSCLSPQQVPERYRSPAPSNCRRWPKTGSRRSPRSAIPKRRNTVSDGSAFGEPETTSGPPSVAMTRASSGEPNQKIPIVSPAAKAAPSSLHRLRSSGGTDFGAKIASGVCACVQTMIGSAMARSRQPVAMRSI